MQMQSVRDLKREIAADVFAPFVNNLLERALGPQPGAPVPSPFHQLALGIMRGPAAGEFILAVRLQTQSALLQHLVERIRAKAHGELDVRFIGRVQAQDGANDSATLRKLCRPLVIGCSVSHVESTAGSLGLIAKHHKTGRTVLLSNSHVLAQAGQAKVGDAVTQPGPLDGGGDKHVAALLDFVPLKLSGANHVDAAIAVVDKSIALTPKTLPGLGAFTVPNVELATPGMKVLKIGRTTGLTRGEITATEMDHVAVDYDIGVASFDDQIEITGMPGHPFSDGGDSGSLVLDEQMRAIGLLFAGSATANDGRGISFANHLPKVMAALALEPL